MYELYGYQNARYNDKNYSEKMNPVHTQDLEMYFSVRHLPMSVPLVFVSSFNFSTEVCYVPCTCAPPLCVLCVPVRLTCLVASSRYLVKGQCVMGKEMFTFCCFSRNEKRT